MERIILLVTRAELGDTGFKVPVARQESAHVPRGFLAEHGRLPARGIPR